MRKRLVTVDMLKGLAIIAVALYHFGGGYGFLGVDVFLVISGYLTVQHLNDSLNNGKFNYKEFVVRRLTRLWPLVLMVSALSLLAGYFLMLPDDYENLAESVVASSFFANNILQCITTGNYWDIVMQYKPLMHLWYVGVLMQIYVILPLLYLVSIKIFKTVQRGLFIGTVVLTAISLGLYMSPFFNVAWKFYYLPCRLFEFTTGGLLAFIPKINNAYLKRTLNIFATAFLIVLLCSRDKIVSEQAMLLLTIIMTLIILACNVETTSKVYSAILAFFAGIGKRSYSIYIWHQAIIAFLFYSVFSKEQIGLSFAVFFVAIGIFSSISYKFVEIPLKRMGRKTVFIICLISALVLSTVSFQIYRNAGVVRDVPELNISKNNVHRNMHAEYCDIPYSWNRDFTQTPKKKVLVIGSSFGRDFANVLYEWDKSYQELEISYRYYSPGVMEKISERVRNADFVFYALDYSNTSTPEEIISAVPRPKLYVVGNKKYGESNGIIYAKRNSANYFSQNIKLTDKLINQNKEQAEIYGRHYIDMLGAVMADDKHVRVFTDDNKFISQDCTHLTQAGAQYYAKTLKLQELFFTK